MEDYEKIGLVVPRDGWCSVSDSGILCHSSAFLLFYPHLLDACNTDSVIYCVQYGDLFNHRLGLRVLAYQRSLDTEILLPFTPYNRSIGVNNHLAKRMSPAARRVVAAKRKAAAGLLQYLSKVVVCSCKNCMSSCIICSRDHDSDTVGPDRLFPVLGPVYMIFICGPVPTLRPDFENGEEDEGIIRQLLTDITPADGFDGPLFFIH